MTFGFGRDVDEVNGWDDYHPIPESGSDSALDADRSSGHGDGSGDPRITLSLKRDYASNRWIRRSKHQHPIYRPELRFCSFCKGEGHSMLNCRKRIAAAEEAIEAYCVHGWHFPHLHDQVDYFRCRWCSLHLDTDYVRTYYPTVAEEQIQRFTARRATEVGNYR